MDIIVDVYATEGGEYLGRARYLGEVSIASVTKADDLHFQYTALRNSGEKTEKYEFLSQDRAQAGAIFYGFEYFVTIQGETVH